MARPYLVLWLCTYRCNLSCIHCYVKGRGSHEMDTERGLKLVSEAAELSPRHFSISGGGR